MATEKIHHFAVGNLHCKNGSIYSIPRVCSL